MDKLKVLQVVGSLSVGSGVSSVMMNYYRQIDKSKIQFDFIVHNDSSFEYEKEIKNSGGIVYRLPRLILKNIFALQRDIEEFLNERSGEYHIIHVHTPNLCTFYFPTAKKRGIKYRISHSHNTKYSDFFWRAARNYFLTIPLKKYATNYIACSKAAGEFLYGKKYVQDGDVLILNNGIDCSKYKYSEQVRGELREQYNFTDKFIIGHIGRFNEQKNHTFLIDIFNEIYKKNNQAVLLLIGEGELQNKIKDKADKLGLSNAVLFMGKRNDIHKLLQIMDIFLLPSLYEGLPVVGIEAQASGLPCVFSGNITKEVKIIEDVKFISLESKPGMWAEEILDLNSRSVRKNTYEQMYEAGYDIKKSAQILEKLYLDLWKGDK